MRKILLMSSAFAVLGLSGTAEAACIQTPSCASLGYDSNSACENGLKCPWGNAWYCKVGELEESVNNAEKAKTCIPGAVFNSDRTCTSKQEVGKVPIGVVVYADGKGHGQAMALNTVSYSNADWIISGLLRFNHYDIGRENYGIYVYYSNYNYSTWEWDQHTQRPLTNCLSPNTAFAFDQKIYPPYTSLEAASLDLDSKGGTDKLATAMKNIINNIKTQFDYAKSFNTYLEQSADYETYKDTLWAKGTVTTTNISSIVDKVRAYKTTGTTAGEWNIPAPAVFNSIKLNYDAINATYKALGKTFSPDNKFGLGYVLGSVKEGSARCPILDARFIASYPYNDKYSYDTYIIDRSMGDVSDRKYYLKIPKDVALKLPYTQINVYNAQPDDLGVFISAGDVSNTSIFITGKRSGSYGTATSNFNSSTYPVIDF